MIGFPTSIASVLVCLGGAGIVLACTPPATLLLFDSADGRYGLLQKLCAVELCATPIERPEWQVACLAGGLEHETVGKAGRGSFPELLQSRSHDVGILKRQVFVITGSHTSCAWQRSVPWRFDRPRQILDEMTSSDISTFE
jgi:hypothetical protein